MAKFGRMKKILCKLADLIADKLGYQPKQFNQHKNQSLEVFSKNSLLYTFCSILKSIDFEPNHIVDIGANHGTWTRELLKYFPDCYYTMIEPQQHLKESIKDILLLHPKVSFYAVGAGKEESSLLFTIHERDDSSSFRYSQEEAEKKGLKQIEIPVITLNQFIKTKNLPIPEVIKIDAEGLDIDVLEGCEDFFGTTEIFLVEAGIVNKKFTNSFLKVINFMNESGYRLFDITDLNRPFKSNVLWLAELVFIKKGGIIDLNKWTNFD